MTKDEMVHMMREFGETVAHSIAAQFEEVMISEMEGLMVKHGLGLDVIEDIMPIMFSAYAAGIHDASEHAMDASKLAMRLIENEEE